MGKTIWHTFKSIQDLAVGWLPWEQESILLTVGKNYGFPEMKSRLKAAALEKKKIYFLTQDLTEQLPEEPNEKRYVDSINLQVRSVSIFKRLLLCGIYICM